MYMKNTNAFEKMAQFWEIFELCILFDTSVEFVFLFSFKRTGVIKCI